MMIPSQTIRRSPGRRIGQGFTILELIVALAVTVLMLVMISALFTATSDGVSMGMALSDVIGAGRAIGDQIENDGSAIYSPVGNPPGLLVIVCQKYPDVTYYDRRTERQRSVRSDQVMWTRDLGKASTKPFGVMPISPAGDATFSSAGVSQMASAEAVRVWYGHVLKTSADGVASGDLGGAGPNRLANRWALGRHALFFNGNPTVITGVNQAASALPGAAVTGITPPTGVPSILYAGLTDVANQAYASGATPFIGSGVSNGSAQTLWPFIVDQPDAVYKQIALSYMFTGTNRLWVNPFPKVDPVNSTTWVKAGQIAQMHPLLMDNVSDFIVEFAADAVSDPDPNNNDSSGLDGEPDRDSAGETIWYGLETNLDTNSSGPPASWNMGTLVGLESPVAAPPSGAGAAYVFRHGTDSQKLWPYMIRIRYRIHDVRGDLLGDKSFEKGDILPDGTGTNSGRWFEQIIKVKRN